MSTVLTNGIIIPDNGSRNWGGDLANNWNIIDVNVGYMTDVKNKVTTLETSVTTLENSVAENTANIQINTSNISALQTSKQDVIEDLETIRAGASSGATAVQPSALNDYATKSEVETELASKANSNDAVLKTNTDYIFRNYNLNTINIDEEYNENYTSSISTDGFGTRPVGGWTQVINFNATHFIMQLCNANGSDDLYVRSRYASLDRKWSSWGKLANDSDVVHKSGNETISGVKNFNNVVLGEQSGVIRIGNNGEGALFCKLYYDGGIYNNSKQFVPTTNNEYNLGTSANKWKDIYATNATINTSDRNAKTGIENIHDDILEAWDKVSLVSFKFKDAVEKKGDDARTHVGYIAQDIKEELSKHGIDACKYGLFCYNKWNAQEEKSHDEERTTAEGNVETVKVIDTHAREAGETYGLRYVECLVVECAYLRKKNKELEDRITKLEKNLNA